jgi:hypothetical protein
MQKISRCSGYLLLNLDIFSTNRALIRPAQLAKPKPTFSFQNQRLLFSHKGEPKQGIFIATTTSMMSIKDPYLLHSHAYFTANQSLGRGITDGPKGGSLLANHVKTAIINGQTPYIY